MAVTATESTLGKTAISVTTFSGTGSYTLTHAVRVKNVILTGTAGDIVCLRENIAGDTTDPAFYITLPNTSCSFKWDSGLYEVTPRFDVANSTLSNLALIKITFQISGA